MHVIDHSRSGGAQKVVLEHIRSLKHQVQFSMTVLGDQGVYTGQYQQLGIPVYQPVKPVSRWSLSPLLMLISVIAKERPDIIHLHLFKSSILGTFAGWIMRKKIILHDHTGMLPLRMRYYIKNRILFWLYQLLFRLALHRCDAVIVLTGAISQAYLHHYPFIANKIFTIPNGVTVEEFAPVPVERKNGALRNELNLDPSSRLVVMIGRLEPEKDWHTFLNVARRFLQTTKVAFLVIGDGQLQTSLQDQMKQDALINTYLLGYRDDIPAILRQADVFLLSSKYEAFPLVVIEAMAAGCPVVLTRSGAEAILHHPDEGLVANAGDDEELANMINLLLQDNAAWEKLSINGRKLVLSTYTWAKISLQVLQLYAKLNPGWD